MNAQLDAVPPPESHNATPNATSSHTTPSHTTRASTQWILARAQHLIPEEARIVRLFLTHLNFGRYETPDDEHTPIAQHSLEDAKLPGLSSTEFHRAANAIIRRMRTPEFNFVIQNSQHWTSRRKQIAWHFFVLGRSQRSTARRLACSLHEVRSELIAVRAIAATQTEQDQRNEHTP